MAITLADLKFFRSERMTDFSDGGGRMSPNEIVSGVENSVFSDVSDVDRAAGDLSIRKTYAAVTSADTAEYLDAGVVVFREPADPNTAVALFSTRDFYDERAVIRNYIESYLVRGPLLPCQLYSTHLTGQMSVSLLMNPSAQLPLVGQTIVLVENENLGNEKEQYVRIKRLSASDRTFTDGSGNYTRTVVDCEITDALRFNFAGVEAYRTTSVGITKVRDTIAASAARYYGIHTVVAEAAALQNKIRVESLYSQLIPSLQTETPILDVKAGTVLQTVSGGARSTQIPILAHTQTIPITLINQQFSYVAQLLPKPAAGTLTVSYRTLGKWYTLTDQGDGTLSGQGVGVVVYSTGSVSITLGAYPDVNSSIAFLWGTPTHFEQPTLDVTSVKFEGWSGKLSRDGIEPGTVVVQWTSSGFTKKAIASVSGQFSGDATGTIRHSTGEYFLVPTLLPDPGSTPQVTYEFGSMVYESFTPTKDGGGFVTLTSEHPIKPKTLTVLWQTKRKKTEVEKTAGAA